MFGHFVENSIVKGEQMHVFKKQDKSTAGGIYLNINFWIVIERYSIINLKKCFILVESSER